MRFKDMVVGILKKNGDRIQPEMAPFNPADWVEVLFTAGLITNDYLLRVVSL